METTTAEVDSPQTEVTGIEDASTNDLRSALGITEAPSQEEVPESETAEVPESAESAPQPEAEGQEPEVESEEEKLAKRRIRPRTELDQQVIDLYRSEGFSGSFADASRIIFGQQSQVPETLPPQEVEAPQPDPYDGQVSDLQSQIADLEAKVEKAAEDLETTEALRLQREIMKRELDLQSLQSRRERQQEARQNEAYQTHRTKAMESRDRAYAKMPDLQDRDSVARKQFDDFVRQAQQDPDYAAVFDSPKWPELMASEFLSLAAPQQQSAPPQQAVPPQPAAPQMGTQAKVLTTGTTAQPANAPLTEQGLTDNLSQFSQEDLYKLLGNAGGPQP
tara:strand:+ start:966 stop:1970 length:1005 start_codon:yes stop_codon:yes gene_type:complete